MPQKELAKQINHDLYPEVVSAGSLTQAVDQALADIASPLRVTAMPSIIPLALAVVRGETRFSQMYVAAHERLFMFDFWSHGVSYGNGTTTNLNEAARAIHYWISEEPNIAEMQRQFSLFEPNEKGKAHEAGRAVEYQWEALLNRWTEDERRRPDADHSLPRLIATARERPQLRQLFPFTSLYRLCFSRTTGYPFTNDCPSVAPIGDGRFRVYAETSIHSDEVIGEGNLEEALDLLVANLPPNCGPAVMGTADDL